MLTSSILGERKVQTLHSNETIFHQQRKIKAISDKGQLEDLPRKNVSPRPGAPPSAHLQLWPHPGVVSAPKAAALSTICAPPFPTSKCPPRALACPRASPGPTVWAASTHRHCCTAVWPLPPPATGLHRSASPPRLAGVLSAGREAGCCEHRRF